MLRGLDAVIYKELRQLRRDPASLFLALLIPVIQLLIFGFAIDTEARDIPTVVVDRSQSRSGRELMEKLTASGTFRLTEHVGSKDEALALLRSGSVRAALLLPEDFEAARLEGRTPIIQLLVDGSDNNLAMQAQAAAFGVASSAPISPRVEARVRFLYNPDGRSERFFVPGIAGIILQLVTMTLASAAIVRERERGTLEQLMVTPVSRFALALGKILPSILIGSVATVLCFTAMVFVFDVPIRGSVWLLAGFSVVFLFTSLALGLLISTIARNQLQALMMTLLILLPSVLLSGFVFPRSTIPSPIYEVTWILPATYFIEILRGVILRGADAYELRSFVVPLAGIGIALFLVVALRFRKTLA